MQPKENNGEIYRKSVDGARVYNYENVIEATKGYTCLWVMYKEIRHLADANVTIDYLSMVNEWPEEAPCASVIALALIYFSKSRPQFIT